MEDRIVFVVIFFGVLFHVTLSILLTIEITTDLLNTPKIFRYKNISALKNNNTCLR